MEAITVRRSALVESGGTARTGEACGVARGLTQLLSSETSSFADPPST